MKIGKGSVTVCSAIFAVAFSDKGSILGRLNILVSKILNIAPSKLNATEIGHKLIQDQHLQTFSGLTDCGNKFV